MELLPREVNVYVQTLSDTLGTQKDKQHCTTHHYYCNITYQHILDGIDMSFHQRKNSNNANNGYQLVQEVAFFFEKVIIYIT